MDDVERVDAKLLDGATLEELEEASKAATAAGRMCIFFPSKDLMDLWLRRVAAPA